ncbi:hypothetical protein HG531_013415 [Fusarium graminearum]|nr:hypothetical protein HG531_013415 [Fusarium graminearum]
MILNRPLDINIQLICGAEHKVWLPKELSCSKHEIGLWILLLFNQRSSERTISDISNCSDQKFLAVSTQCLTDLTCEVGLERLANLDLLRLKVATAADIKNVDPQCWKLLSEINAALEVPRWFIIPFHPLCGRNTHPEGQLLGNNSANGFDDLE